MPPTPRQLPVSPSHFTGRTRELAELDRLASGPGATNGIVLVVIVAAGGVGKTTLASRWLHAIGDRYDAGALFADLRGHEPTTAADPGDVAVGFLRALGLPPERFPQDVSEQSALLRSVTAGRRTLVLLDNAASAAQVRLLLPGPGPGPDQPSLVVVTTRWRIAGLVMEGARFLELGPLEEPAALDLFDRMVGPGRAAAEPGERDTIVRLTGGHPLAICVSAARLAARPRWRLSRLAAELSGEQTRLRAMSLEGDISVRAAFDVAYQTLEPGMKRAYRMSAHIPGPSFDTELAAAALDAGTDTEDLDAEDLLEALTDACLLGYAPGTGPGNQDDGSRYQFHDLARLHARELATPEERETAVARAVDWYLARAVAADFTASPGRWRLNPRYEAARASPPAYPDSRSALDWLESRLPGLLAAVEAAHAGGLHRQAWQLCEALWNVFVVRKHFREWISAHHAGLEAAKACGDPRAQAQMHNQLGFALLTLQRFGEAREHFLTALELSRRDGHDLGTATALEDLGLVDMAEGDPGSAITRFAEFRDILFRLGRRRGVAIATRRIGEAQRDLGRYDDALRELAAARRIFADLSELYLETRTLTSIAQTLLLAGRTAEAFEPLTAALDTAARLGSRYEQARIARYLGQAATALGDIPAARRHLSDALAGFEATAAPDASGVRDELASLPGDEPAPPDTTT